MFKCKEVPMLSTLQQPSAARITEIDINRPARALAWLRCSDFTLVIACGLSALAMLPDLISAGINAQWDDLVADAVIVATLSFAAYTGWRHVGIIDQRIWRSYLWVFPLLAGVVVMPALVTAVPWLSEDKPFDDGQSIMTLVNLLAYLG